MPRSNTRLRFRRQGIPLSQAELAEQVGVTEVTVRRWEAGLRLQPVHIRRLCAVFNASPSELGYGSGGERASTGADSDDERQALRLPGGLADTVTGAHLESLKLDRHVELESTEMVPWAGAGLAKPASGHDASRQLLFSGGRFFDGAAVEVHLRPGSVAGEAVILADGDELEHRESHPRQLLPELVVGAVETGGTPQLFVLDGRVARRRLAGGVSGQRGLAVPCGYLLDDLTFGILWATANLDASLLADDSALAEARRGLRAYDRLKASAVSREVAPDLTGVSQRWLGSEYCARHILRNREDCTGSPFFWTCEQRGEEASPWLLFGHKYAYLRRTSRRFGGDGSESPVRAFCIPEDAVAGSPAWERLLVFLAAALMESVGIRVAVCTEPDLSRMEGFVLGSGRRAIIANWVRSDGI